MKRIVSVIMAALLLFAALPSMTWANETVPQEITAETCIEEAPAPTEEEVPASTEMEASLPTGEETPVPTEGEALIYEEAHIDSILNSGENPMDGIDDSYDNPQSISNGQTRTGTVHSTFVSVEGGGWVADQNDYFRFTLTKKTKVTIRVSSDLALGGVVLWDGDGVNLANGTVINKQLSAGTYIVGIQNNPNTGMNNYSISLSYCAHVNADMTVIIPETCTDSGTVLYDCPSCYESWTESAPATGHNYGGWTVVSKPTCTGSGVKESYCSKCNARTTETIPATGHDFGSWTETRAATCEGKGLESAFCSRCGEEKVQSIPALGHAYGDGEITREPTCSLEGANTKTCLRCSAKSSESIPLAEHTFGEWVVTKEATCETEGSRIRFCPVCGASETEVFTLPHDYKPQELKKLYDNGYALYTFKCYDCGTTDQDEAYFGYTSGSVAEGTTRIGDSAFEGTNLASIHIPDSVTSIGKAAFKNTKLTSITIPKGVTNIQEETFAYCYNLSKVTFPGVLSRIGPEGVTSIGRRAFVSCRNLTSIVLPLRLETVGEEAFDGTGLKKIVIPQGVKSLGSRAFPYTLQKITFSGYTPSYPSYNRAYDQPFGNCTADAYYPEGKWSSRAQEGVGMNLNWITCEHPDTTSWTCTFPSCCNSCGTYGAYLASHTATEATCTEPSVCTTCENVIVEALGHLFENYAPNNDMTCTANGTETAKCERCDATHTREIPGTLLGHSFADHEGNGDAKCYLDGTKTAKCQRCDAANTITDPGTAIEHTTALMEGKKPTCLEAGLTDGAYCTMCGVVTKAQNSIPATGHSYTDNKDTTCNVCSEERDLADVSVPMHRMYDPNSGEHFYTGAEAERDFLVAAGWHYEGVGFNFPVEGAPVHRLYDPVYGEHLYTMDKQEMNRLLNKGWQYEGVAFNSASFDEVPQYRLHNPNAKRGGYHFTGSLEERNLLISFGWIDQGIGWYSCLE